MSLMRAAAVVGSMTMLSRLSGFVRDMLIAAVLGTGLVADAYFVAFKFPNLFRRLFAEGAFNSAFIPLFARRLEGEGMAEAKTFAEEAFSLLFCALLALTLIAEIAMPIAMYVMAPGFSDTPEKFDLAVLLTRIAFPYLLFVSLVALYSGVLNSMGRFAAAAAAPVLLNITLICVLLVAPPASAQAGIMLAWGVAFAGFLQFAVLAWVAARSKFWLKLRMPKLTPNMRTLLKLGVPGLIAGGITQVNLMIGSIIASLQDGAVSFLYYADRIYQLPLGVIGVAVGVVLLPELARRLRADDHTGVQSSQNRACEISLFLTIPAAIALIVIPYPIVSALYERGAFNAADSLATAKTLGAFALGLPAFVLIKVFSPAYFAREDTKTPMIYAGISVVLNSVGSLILVFVMGYLGIAIATSVAAWVNAGLLIFTLKRKGEFIPDARLKKRLARICATSALMGAFLFFANHPLKDVVERIFSLSPHGALGMWVSLILLIALGLGVFALLAHLLDAARLSELKASFKRR